MTYEHKTNSVMVTYTSVIVTYTPDEYERALASLEFCEDMEVGMIKRCTEVRRAAAHARLTGDYNDSELCGSLRPTYP